MKCIMINILGPGKKDAYEIKTGMQLWRQVNRNAPRETSLYNKREIVGHLVSKKFGEGHKNFIPPTITGHLFVSTPTQLTGHLVILPSEPVECMFWEMRFFVWAVEMCF